MRLTLVTPPTDPLIKVEELRTFLDVEDPHKDELIETLVEVATQWVEGREGITRKQFRQAQWKYTTAATGVKFELPLPPLQTVQSIHGIAANGARTELTGFKVVPDAYVGYVVLEEHPNFEDIEILFTCGYPQIDEIPATLRHAVRLLVGHFYENREATLVGPSIRMVPLGVSSLLSTNSIAMRQG